ncbi:MAG: 30S ribosomal protein S2 [Candidatus Staskawiczbacteria bacterium RIFCSPLOWO2_01_FULL_40_39]|uniref:Small ribosomal subunit protein uS2 n=1 Tax=Candidatus Staskawiczbacteria bacterium RIFCSPHIGHO2_01_FULL_39_25 TaxID=1802202 RepID=A0A1G2HQU1_9BACT|nr:MAG: 30S ribosomal protein S2 [Candidatus Staskawiczbacteria bacterium RIFCSPHIGHO2_01_FULL_39_25]OGZ72757.1 MAG: 30S ribosomal protein S2 [Candidatus Staskawiczbacteria bacterium RIFCSPLOWO2_01_FULL_40_39]OGZ76745.1 MAG: 30S ribosomal protein S2 [Candidatus Staskawiczbacteria bacterium RIFCSPLOWO2_02_FULL_39_8]
MVDDIKINLNIEEMQKAGLNFGHNVSRLHPRMKPYVAGIKNNVHMIDLEKTAKEFERALKFIAKLAGEGKTILFVGTKIQTKELVKATAEDCKMPYVAERWLGGTFTNFETISKRVAYFKELEHKKASGALEKYTKKERANFDKEIESLRIKFEGIKNLAKIPEAVLILDIKKDITCAREAKRKKITIIGVTDTNIDPALADYAIPANDDAISSVKYILEKIQEVILNGKS